MRHFETGRGLAVGTMLAAVLLSRSFANAATSARAELEDGMSREGSHWD
jgi:hypothetical protein